MDVTPTSATIESDFDARIAAEARELLLALDRLMTVGTYYQPGHAQHEAVAEQCEDTVRRCLATRHTLDIEVTAEGLKVFGVDFPAGSREARRLFDLVDPLSLGVLRIKPGATAKHLQDAIAVLRTRRNNISASTAYEEIEITGMPENIEALGRSLYLRTRTGGGNALNGAYDPHLITPEMLLDGADLHKSEAEFLKIINGLIKAGSGGDGKSGTEGPGFDLSRGLPESVLVGIQEIISSLVGTNSDPMVYNHLIDHARSALEMTGDPELVELVFQQLRKETETAAESKAHVVGMSKARKRKSGPQKFNMSMAELDAAIAGLTEPYGPHENPESMDRACCLGVCVQILRAAPPRELESGAHATLRRIFGAPGFSGPERRAAARIAVELLGSDDRRRDEPLLRMMWEMLREYRPQDVGEVWREVWSILPPRLRLRAWPYTVNDILLGMEWKRPLEMLALYGALSRVPVAGKSRVRYTLENLPALKTGTLSDDIFEPPPPLLFPALNVLIGTSIAPVLGPLLHDHLLRLRTHPLAAVMLEAATEYHPGNRVVYQAILEQGVREKLTDRMVELGGRLLSLALLRLPPGERKETWIPEAINWLGKLAPENAEEVLARITSERKMLLIPAWPKHLREAAEAAWASLGEDKETIGSADDVGAFDVDDDAGVYTPSPVMPEGKDAP